MRTSSLTNVKVPASKLGSIVDPGPLRHGVEPQIPLPPLTCGIGRTVISWPAVTSTTQGSTVIGSWPAGLTLIVRLPAD